MRAKRSIATFPDGPGAQLGGRLSMYIGGGALLLIIIILLLILIF